jgi:uncharacterized membrane protein
MIKTLWRTFLAGLAIIVPTWATVLILITLFKTLDNVIGDYMTDPFPGLGFVILMIILIVAGVIADHVIGEKLLNRLEQRLEQIPLVQSIYMTLKGMTDLVNFRTRFNHRKVVAFPFPRTGLWALGFVMGEAPASVQVSVPLRLHMVFVPTAIHPFTGYLALLPDHALFPLNLSPEDAMKMEFSAGFYRPRTGWLSTPEPNS